MITCIFLHLMIVLSCIIQKNVKAIWRIEEITI